MQSDTGASKDNSFIVFYLLPLELGCLLELCFFINDSAKSLAVCNENDF